MSFQQGRQFSIFLLVGVLNTIFGYLVYGGCILLGFHYGLSLIIATPIAVAFSFLSTGRIVFGNRSLKPLLFFLLSQAILFALNYILLSTICRFGVGPLIAQLICLPICVVTGYVFSKYFVFRTQH